jgi:hypothetical protein
MLPLIRNTKLEAQQLNGACLFDVCLMTAIQAGKFQARRATRRTESKTSSMTRNARPRILASSMRARNARYVYESKMKLL